MKILIFILFALLTFACDAQFYGLNQNIGTDFTDNLVAYYKMDDASGDMSDDISTYDYTVDGATQGETGIIGDCYYFDGVDDYCYGLSPVGQITGDSLTLAIWFKPDDLSSMSNDMYLWRDRTTSGTSDTLGIQIYRPTGSPTKTVGGVIWSNGTTGSPSDTIIVDDEWFLAIITMRRSSTTVNYIYDLNAGEDSEQNLSRNNIGFYGETTVGYLARHFTATFHFKGWIDNIALWDKILTQDEIDEYYLKRTNI